jgi:hypothetical protein
MRSSVRLVFVFTLLTAFSPSGLQAQSALDRPVGLDFFGKPLVLTKLTASDVSALATAARVPMGFEAAAPRGSRDWKVDASGRPLRAVLDAIVAADSRYEWRDDNGVIVLRPSAAWRDRDSVLYRNVGSIRFDAIGPADALRIAAGLFGTEILPSQRNDLGETKRFRLDLPPGTILDALNGIVRSHGMLAWGLEPWPPTPLAPGSVVSPFMVSLGSGSAGVAMGIGVSLDREPQVPELVKSWRRPQPPPAGPVLDRIVGRRYNGDPFVLHGAHDLKELAFAAQIPMGVELLPAPSPAPTGVRVTGLTVRDALTALMALDPRYDWREFDGVIVVRPLFAWAEPEHPLAREIPAVRLDNATITDAINFQHSLLEPGLKYAPERDRGIDVPRLSANVPRGPLLALLNALARSHRELCWIYQELNDRDTEFFGDRRHQLSVQVPSGAGLGFAFR